MKAKELKILRKRLVKAKRCDELLQGFNNDTTFSFHTTGGVNDESEESSESDSAARRNNLSTIFARSSEMIDSQSKECLDLFEKNMGEMYRKSSWGLNMEEKSAELRDDKARFLLLLDNNEKLTGFVHFRFEYDDEESPTCAVLYIFEIQIESTYRRCGAGKKLMGIAERIAREQSMTKVLLTVFKSNHQAMAFYTKKLGYNIDESSPSKFGESADYEILSLEIIR